ncbi:outer membrane protein assembly factor BamC [uncultured Gilliamella sp.]|uniref:outer membrane protein assembly factor BamC n=1 Tax=uncultured Gilliamella sp. TaxID=1193505 RepID=UPI0025E49EF7|nr:outer membrane protein assembly factor BamC [uncultured Gilliamella sp.]
MFNKTVCKCAVLKITVIMTVITSFFLVGCGNDQNYKREIDGNEDYLNSPSLKPLVIPQGINIPTEAADFYVYPVETKGAVGKLVDIRPPLLPIPTIVDAYANYSNGVATLNAPANSGVWSSITTTLNRKNIPISSSDNNTIRTANAFILSDDEQQTVQASYVIQRHTIGGAETITVALNSLTRGAEDLSSNPLEVQRYVVTLFNAIMDDAAPPSARIPTNELKGNEKQEETNSASELLKDLKDN